MMSPLRNALVAGFLCISATVWAGHLRIMTSCCGSTTQRCEPLDHTLSIRLSP